MTGQRQLVNCVSVPLWPPPSMRSGRPSLSSSRSAPAPCRHWPLPKWPTCSNKEARRSGEAQIDRLLARSRQTCKTTSTMSAEEGNEPYLIRMSDTIEKRDLLLGTYWEWFDCPNSCIHNKLRRPRKNGLSLISIPSAGEALSEHHLYPRKSLCAYLAFTHLISEKIPCLQLENHRDTAPWQVGKCS